MQISTLVKTFFKLGILGFGGPAAHIALMREEVVEKRKWLTEAEFFDLVGATNLIPGPNSTELAIHIGHRMLGWRGLISAGMSFILPAFFAVLSLAVLYGEYGSLPDLSPILSGMRPVIVAIIFAALLKFRESAVRNYKEWGLLTLSLIAAYFGMNEVLIIFLAGILMMGAGKFSLFPLAVSGAKISISSSSIFFFFLKIGSVLFGSGYVLLAFLRSELVEKNGWITDAQLLDAITVGQITPGPVFTTATFIGYLLQSYQGAILATIGIFLPSFFFVALSAPYIPKIRSSEKFSRFLDGVNVASFALMTLVTFELGAKSLLNIPTVLVALVSFGILRFTRWNSAYLLLAGGVIGYFFLSHP